MSRIDKLRALVSRAVRRFWQTDLLAVHCRSIGLGRSLPLPCQLLSSAETGLVHLKFRRPCGWLRRPRPLEYRLSGSYSCGEMQDQGAITSPRSNWEAAILVSETEWKLKQSTRGRITRAWLRISLPALAGCRDLHLEIYEHGCGKLVARLALEVVDAARAERIRLAQLKTGRPELWVRAGTRLGLAAVHCVVDSCDCLIPKVCLVPSALGAWLPPRQVCARWKLLAGGKQICLEEQSLELGAKPVMIQASPIRVRDGGLFRSPGHYRLVASIEGKDVATFLFRLITQSEWLRRIRVPQLDLATETAGRPAKVQKRRTLSWSDRLAFRPRVLVRTSVPAPENLVPCTAQLLQGDTVLWHEEFQLHLRGACQHLWLPKFRLSELAESARAKPLRLKLFIRINARLKAAWRITILPAEQLTNFEGQLKRKCEDLPLDENAYHEILSRLGAAHEPCRRISS